MDDNKSANYTIIQKKLNDFYEVYENLQNKNRILEATYDSGVSEIKNDIGKRNEYLEYKKKLNAFISIAKAHSEQGEEIIGSEPIDISFLSKLAVQINNSSKSDSFAEKLYFHASRQLRYVEELLADLSLNQLKDLDILRENYEYNADEYIAELNKLEKEFNEYINSSEFVNYIDETNKSKAIFEDGVTNELVIGNNFSIGTASIPVEIPEPFKDLFENVTKGNYDREKNLLQVPVYIDFNQGTRFFVEYDGGNEAKLFGGIVSLIMNFLRYYSDRIEQIAFVDPVRFNGSALGVLEQYSLEPGYTIMRSPFSMEEISTFISTLLKELNKNSLEKIDINAGRRILIFHDYPNSYNANTVQMIQQLSVNAERYNLSVIITNKIVEKSRYNNDSCDFLKDISDYISCSNNTFFWDEKENVRFRWYNPTNVISDSMLDSMKHENVDELNNNYFSRKPHATMVSIKGNRNLENIPYAIDENGVIQYIDFENSNFATYICGAARSGKSTLLHSLIASLIINNHPDDVEIWLVDFKMTEFSLYANNIPPHVRYIILDESPELVYDLIDRLTEILIKRQSIFKGKWQKLSDVPKEKYMPSIMVIIDEFSVMSQIVAESISISCENYVMKLQNLLAKGSALGMHFIFASQGFTNGTRGLSEFSKNQIQQRIAMKTDYNEIKDTLELKTPSEMDRLMMEQLESHYALVKKNVDEMGNHLKLVKPLCIKNYDELDGVISDIKEKYKKRSVYSIDDAEGYIYKNPLIVDGNNYVSFNEKKHVMKDYINSLVVQGRNEDIFLFLGEPRRMASVYPIQLSNEFRENMLVIASVKEKMSASSIVLSILDSLELVGKNANIWTSKTNEIYKQIIPTAKEVGDNMAIDIEEICSKVKDVKNKIENRISDNGVYILLGMEMILMEMSYLDNKSDDAKNNQSDIKEIVSIEKRDDAEMDILSQMVAGSPVFSKADDNTVMTFKKDKESDRLYDAREDLKYIIKHGPRFGYHFILLLNSTGDFTQNRLDESLFRHKVFFRNSKNETFGYVNSLDARVISEIETHHFRYSNGIESLSYRPYLHRGLSWDGWIMSGDSVENCISDEEYLL